MLVVSVVAMVAVLSGQPKRGSALPEELLGMPTLPSMAPLAALRPGKDGYFESLKRKRGGLGRGKRIGKRIGKKIGKIGAKIGAKIGSMSKKIGRIGAAAAAGSSAASTSSSSSSAISSSTQSSSSSMSSAASFAEGKFQGDFWALPHDVAQNVKEIPDLDGLGAPSKVIESEVIDFDSAKFANLGWHDDFAVRWKGMLEISEADTYKFLSTSDDGSKIYVNNVMVVDNDGLHPPKDAEGSLFLDVGTYPIKVEFFEHGGGADLVVKYSGADTGGQFKLIRSTTLDGTSGKSASEPRPRKDSAPVLPEADPGEPCCATQCSMFDEEEEQEVGQKDEATTASFKGEIWSLRSEDGSYPFGKPEKLPDFGALGNPQSTIESEVIDLNDEAWKQIGWRDNFAARWTGLLVVRAGGTYKFFTESDDGSKLFINGDLVVDNDGLHPPLTKEGTMDLEAGQYEIKVLFFEHQGGADIRVKYAGPDTDGETKLLKARSMSLQGSGEQDAKMKASASVMGASTSVNRWSMLRKELHAEASQVARKSSRAGQNRGSSRRLLADGVCDCAKCPKVPGFEAAYYKMEGASSVDDIPTGAPDWVGSCLDIDFDAKAFHSIAEGFPQANFGARWKGEMQVLVAGSYNFYSKSDDGSKVYVNKRLVVDYDGLHGANEWKQGTIELEAGWHVVEVSYFERSGDQKIEIKYSGPDTLGTPVLLRGFHVGIIPAQDPTPPDVMFPGFMAQYFKLPVDTVNAVPDLRGRTPFLTGISLDVDYDSESFKEVSDELTDGFAVRWTGEIKVTQGGMYTFFSNSDGNCTYLMPRTLGILIRLSFISPWHCMIEKRV